MVKDRSARAALFFGALLALGGTATAAQEAAEPGVAQPAADPPAAVSVQGTSTLVGQGSPGVVALDGSVFRLRGSELATVEASSDDRVSGQAFITVNYDAYPDADGTMGATQVRYGEMQLVNDGGTWEGTFSGSFSNGAFVQTYWLEGTGAYEGYSYVVTAGGMGSVWASQGLIFPGALPPTGSSVSLPIDSIDIDVPAAFAPPG